MSSERLTIRTPARLHFGLLGWGPGLARQFGGLGLMIEEPAIEILAECSSKTRITGLLAERAARIQEIVRARLADQNIKVPCFHLQISKAPPEHVGLGVGTQLSLSIAAAAYHLAGQSVPPASHLARLTGRGMRSGIGLHGFDHGGLIVDGGRKGSDDVPAMIIRLEFPLEWSIVVIRPLKERGLHGQQEIEAFRDLPAVPPGFTEKLCRTILLDLLPSVAAANLLDFGMALEELQREVGGAFAPAQGGIFQPRQAHEIFEECRKAGLVGCGQSSWGPTIYAFSEQPRSEVERLVRKLEERLGIGNSSIMITRATNRGAEILAK